METRFNQLNPAVLLASKQVLLSRITERTARKLREDLIRRSGTQEYLSGFKAYLDEQTQLTKAERFEIYYEARRGVIDEFGE
ncbi:hypothetical protein [uncultured Draconibacterium sp.]|uniref:hypothetical protein n=1 Tax=uncultured Draconibacterium sp. TaxID=1573823 RepID=UPI0029C8E4A9|nr:hypothetical protein [uncultured Draconibacterium sp.]